jgi:NitT/TauT family transport system ATP-binding protein
MTDDFVELRQLSMSYGSGPQATQALDGVDLSISEGQFAAVVGPSGCGKSSLMKVVTGLTPASKGEVRVAGIEVHGPIKIVGMAFQNSTLLPWRTTLDNVMLPLEVVEPHKRLLSRQRSLYEEKARNLLAAVGLAGFEDKLPWQLSGGMQQRASLCRALIHEPKLLMLDEPFGALDAFTREELWGVLHDLWAERHFTVILVTHDLREAVYLADIVFVMSNRPGRIIASKTVARDGPRRIEDTSRPEFNETVQELREHIWRLRTQ